MKNRHKIKFTKIGFGIFVLTALIISGCTKNENPTPKGKYESGVFVINEGNFSDADGSLGHYNPETSENIQKAFELENTRPFGGLLQSVIIYNDRIYLVDNLGSRIEVADANTLTSILVISEELSLPRYMVIDGNKGYVSNWGPFAQDYSSPESFIAVLNIETGNILKTINVNSRPEGLKITNGKLFVSSLASSQITVIDITNDKITETIETSFGPSNFVSLPDGHLWFTTMAGNLNELDALNNKILQTIEISNLEGKLTIDKVNKIIYVLTSTWAPDFSFTDSRIVAVALSSPANYKSIYSTRNIYGLGYRENSNEIYLANANAFTGNGTILIISPEGEDISNFISGRGPNGFIFRY